jgi:hypothetical protein
MQKSADFEPREHLISIRSRQGSSEYLPVQWRLVWFRNECPEGSIETELVHLDLDKETEEEVFVWNAEKRRNESTIKIAKGIAIFRATVKDGKGGIATGTGSERAASFGDFIEKAETKAIGRALAGLGYGTQFAPELNEEHRIVDSPVDPSPAPQPTPPTPAPEPRQLVPSVKPLVSSPAQPTSTLSTPSFNAMRERCKKIKIDFDAFMITILKASYDEDTITSEKHSKLNSELVKREQNYSANVARKGNKAS